MRSAPRVARMGIIGRIPYKSPAERDLERRRAERGVRALLSVIGELWRVLQNATTRSRFATLRGLPREGNGTAGVKRGHDE
jgi:hypothetical protein